MDVVYRTLLKMGFHASDVMEAFGGTASSDINHLLDWVRERERGREGGSIQVMQHH